MTTNTIVHWSRDWLMKKWASKTFKIRASQRLTSILQGGVTQAKLS